MDLPKRRDFSIFRFSFTEFLAALVKLINGKLMIINGKSPSPPKKRS